ncbi:MAG: Fe-S cluster assembly protein HesB [Actinomycetota bacterium]|nr:Fe-S cluster assembly protein HesB [Actinomycetota bacterium]
MAVRLQIAQDPDADAVLSADPFALLTGMLLDQQFPMERAFAGPAVIKDRFGTLAPTEIAAADPEQFAALCARPPAVHRFPKSMAARVQALAAHVEREYAGDAARLWQEADTGAELLRRLQGLPGFGRQKAQIFVALLGKQLQVRPARWREAAGAYGEDGSYRSVADVVDAESLRKVRAYKQQAKSRSR